MLGNYDISPEHPQALFDINSAYRESLPSLLKSKNWKELAILAANGELRADRENVNTIRQIAAEHNVDCSDELLLCSDSDGYDEICNLLKKRSPDAMFIIGELWVGMHKFRNQHPGVKLPEIIVNGGVPLIGAANSVYDHVLDFPKNETLRFVNDAIEKIISQLDLSDK